MKGVKGVRGADLGGSRMAKRCWEGSEGVAHREEAMW